MLPKPSKLIFLSMVFFLFLATPFTKAAVFEVKSNKDLPDINPGDGICSTQSGSTDSYYCTLPAAIEEANLSPESDILNLTYYYSFKESTTPYKFIITSDITINGDSTLPTAIEFSPSYDTYFGGFYVSNKGTLTLNSIDIVGGDVTTLDYPDSTYPVDYDKNFNFRGGAIRNNGFLNINNSIVRFAHAERGGGIYNAPEGILKGNNVEFRANSADRGGALLNQGTASFYLGSFHSNSAMLSIYSKGGAILNQGILTLQDVDFETNLASVNRGGGGAIYNTAIWNTLDILDSNFINKQANLSVKGGTFNNNFAGIGAAITNDGGLAEFYAVKFTNNDAVYGGALANTFDSFNPNSSEPTLVIKNSTISGNTALYGGGLFNSSSTVIENSTFSSNNAYLGKVEFDGIKHDNNGEGGLGGGIYVEGSRNSLLQITNSTFSSNKASVNGGGIYANAHEKEPQETIPEIRFSNVTLAKNSTSNSEGGGNVYVGRAKISAVNTLIADNLKGGNCIILGNGIYSSLGGNLSDDNSCKNLLVDNKDYNNIASFSLSSLANNGGSTKTHSLDDPSSAAAVDKGVDTIIVNVPMGNGTFSIEFKNVCQATDQRNKFRGYTPCDIGAYELDAKDKPLVDDGGLTPKDKGR